MGENSSSQILMAPKGSPKRGEHNHFQLLQG